MGGVFVKDSLQDQMDEFLQEEKAESTITTYERNIKYFWSWAGISKGLVKLYPVPEKIVKEFALDHVKGLSEDINQKMVACGAKRFPEKHTVSTVKAKLNAITHIHNELGHDNPCDSKDIRGILRIGQKREAKAGIEKKQKRAITKSMLVQMIDKIDTKTLKGLRDQAIMEWIFYTGGRRRSEASHALYHNLRPVKSGFEYNLHQSKTDQTGKGSIKLLRSKYSVALKQWIKRANITNGYLFRKLTRGGSVNTERLSGHSINDIVKKYVEEIGEDPSHYGAHSLRRGFITHCGRMGIPIFDVMALTGHKKIETAMIYYEQGKIRKNSATKI